jgi:glycosyltransferase involved in cell wall biosynthesis
MPAAIPSRYSQIAAPVPVHHVPANNNNSEAKPMLSLLRRARKSIAYRADRLRARVMEAVEQRRAQPTAAALHRWPEVDPATGLPRAVTMMVPDDRIDRRVLLQGRTLARHGVRVTVVASTYPGPDDIDRAQFPELEILRIDNMKAPEVERDLRTGRLSSHDVDWKELYWYTQQFLELGLGRPADLVVAHDLPVLPAAIALADRTGARLFYDAHELYPEQHHFGPERTTFYARIEAALIGVPDVVTTVNQSIAREMASRYGVAEPGVILNAPEAADDALPVPRNTLLRDDLGIESGKLLFLFQGNLSINRNLEALVEAMALVEAQDVVLVLMGPGETKRHELEGMAERLGLLQTRVLFHDPVPQRDLLRYSASADVGLIPYPAIDVNTTLCTPNKLFEFLVAGVPILANDLPELRRFVLGNKAGMTHAMGSPIEIAAAIDAMVRSDRDAFRAGAAAAAPNMTWAAQEPAVLDAYRRAMRPRRGI